MNGQMEKEKQITEMAKDICTGCRERHKCENNNVCAMAEIVAKHLYNAGYRKERQGEWVFDFALDDTSFYRCSVCGRQETLLTKESTDEYFPYCHCGAKMKGAE